MIIETVYRVGLMKDGQLLQASGPDCSSVELAEQTTMSVHPQDKETKIVITQAFLIEQDSGFTRRHEIICKIL